MNVKLEQIARTYSNDPLYSFEMALEDAYQSGRDAQRESDYKKLRYSGDAYHDACSIIYNNAGEL